MIYLNWIKFVWFKQSIFEPNKNLLKLNKFLPQIKQIIFLTIYECNNLFVFEKNLFHSNKYLFGPKIFFKLNKCYSIQLNLLFQSKKAFQRNYFLSFNQIFFLGVQDRQSKDLGSNPSAVESIFFSTERFSNSLNVQKYLWFK